MKISEKFIVSSVGGENVILPIDDLSINYQSVFMLNDTGMFIVSKMPATHEEIVDALTEKYELNKDEASKYLDEFVKELNKHGILE